MVKERERGGWRHRLDRLTPFQNHYCIIWIWMLDLASRLFGKRMLRSDAISGCSWTIDSNDLVLPCFFFLSLDRLCERE